MAKQHGGSEGDLTRRDLYRLGAAAVVVAATPWLARPAGAQTQVLASEIPANEMLLNGIGFVSQSEKEGQQCGNCLLYQAAGDGRGTCQIIQQGVVPEQGWCLSWSPKA